MSGQRQRRFESIFLCLQGNAAAGIAKTHAQNSAEFVQLVLNLLPRQACRAPLQHRACQRGRCVLVLQGLEIAELQTEVHADQIATHWLAQHGGLDATGCRPEHYLVVQRRDTEVKSKRSHPLLIKRIALQVGRDIGQGAARRAHRCRGGNQVAQGTVVAQQVNARNAIDVVQRDSLEAVARNEHGAPVARDLGCHGSVGHRRRVGESQLQVFVDLGLGTVKFVLPDRLPIKIFNCIE